METAGEKSRRKMIYVRWNVSERIYSATLEFKDNVMVHTIPFLLLPYTLQILHQQILHQSQSRMFIYLFDSQITEKDIQGEK